MRVFACVPNVSEGRDARVIDACADAIAGAGASLAHRTSDPAHHRSVFTFFGTHETVVRAALALAAVAVDAIDLRTHRGVHPRIGALDVLPFVPYGDATLADAAGVARDAAARLWSDLRVPSYYYGAVTDPPRALADVRRGEFEGLTPASRAFDVGDRAHPGAGATAAGARAPLVAFNVVLASDDVALGRRIARALRERDGGLRTLRALAFVQADGHVQVSCNLTDPAATPLHVVTGIVAELARRAGVAVARTELIGLVPRAALRDVAAHALGVEVTERSAQ